MSVSALVWLLDAAAYDLKPVKHGHTRTVTKQMLHAWNDGMAARRNPRFGGGDEEPGFVAIAVAGISMPAQPELMKGWRKQN